MPEVKHSVVEEFFQNSKEKRHLTEGYAFSKTKKFETSGKPLRFNLLPHGYNINIAISNGKLEIYLNLLNWKLVSWKANNGRFSDSRVNWCLGVRVSEIGIVLIVIVATTNNSGSVKTFIYFFITVQLYYAQFEISAKCSSSASTDTSVNTPYKTQLPISVHPFLQLDQIRNRYIKEESSVNHTNAQRCTCAASRNPTELWYPSIKRFPIFFYPSVFGKCLLANIDMSVIACSIVHYKENITSG